MIYYSNSLYFIIDTTLQPNLGAPASGIVSGGNTPSQSLKKRYFQGISEVIIPDPNVFAMPDAEGMMPTGAPTTAPTMEGSQPVGGISTGPMSTPTGGGGY